MRDDFEIRLACDADAAEISALINDVAHHFSANRGGVLAQWFADTITPTAIGKCISDDKFHYLAAWSGARIAGVIAMRDRSHVHHLFVARAFQRRGVATRLWQRAKDAALAAGNDGGFSVRSSEYAVPVYERFGFRVAGKRGEMDGIVFVPMRLVCESSQAISN